MNSEQKPHLSSSEMLGAAIQGIMRRINAIKKAKAVPYGDPTIDLWGLDVESCAAEMLVGKYINQFWHQAITAPGERTPADVGNSIEVRYTPRLDGRLIVHHRDADTSKFVLVTGAYPNLIINGWIFGADAKQECFWWEQARTPAFFVPQTELDSPESLNAKD